VGGVRESAPLFVLGKMSKLTLHLQEIPGWVPSFVNTSGVKYIKIVNPPGDDPFPGVRVIGRFYMPDSDSNAMVWRGAEGAAEWFDWIAPQALARPYLWAIEGPNEPQPIANPDFRKALTEFTKRLGFLMHTVGLRLVGMNWSVGWPDVGDAADFGPAMEHMDYLGLHEYSAPAMWDGQGYYCLRYRRAVQELQEAGFDVPPILITECGIDGGVLGQEHAREGWAKFANEDQYLAQLKWYSSELDRDSRVEAATVFTLCSWDWHSFNVPESLGMKLAEFIRDDTPVTPGEPAKSFFLSEYQKHLNLADLQAAYDAGYRVAHIRASVGDEADPYFDQWWGWTGMVGFKRTAWHYLKPGIDGQAALFKRVVGTRDPVALFGDFEDHDLTIEKCDSFLEAADRQFADWCSRRNKKVDIYTAAWWLDPRGTPDWETQGRKLWVAYYSNADRPLLPKAFENWEWWQWKCAGDIEPFAPVRVCVDRFRGTNEDLEREYPNSIPEPPPPSNGGRMKIYDWEGQEQNWSWLRGKYGDVQILVPEGGTTWVVDELREDLSGSNTLIVVVQDADGNIMPGVSVAFAWPDGSTQTQTKDTGRAEFPMGGGAYYQPPVGGPHKVWVAQDGNSEVVDGLGMLFGTNHHHLDVAFRKVGNVGPPTNKYTLSLEFHGQGVVVIEPDQLEYEEGEVVILNANPSLGWRFHQWRYDSRVSGANPLELVMDSNKYVTVVFQEVEGIDVDAAIAEARQVIEHAEAALRYLGE